MTRRRRALGYYFGFVFAFVLVSAVMVGLAWAVVAMVTSIIDMIVG